MKDIQALFDGKLTEIEAEQLILQLSDAPVTADLLVELATAMRSRMVQLDLGVPTLDTCGTGGDAANTFNISTATALALSKLRGEMAVPIAKHGNIAATSVSGSADVLQALGTPIDLVGDIAKDYFDTNNFVFLFARLYHPAMKHVAPIRAKIAQEHGRKTIFNILGPLCNPAKAAYQVVGVPDPTLAPIMAEALIRLGVEHAVVVSGQDESGNALDEVSVSGSTLVIDAKAGSQPNAVRAYTIQPHIAYPLSDLQVGSVEESAEIIRGVLAGEMAPAVRAVMAMNIGMGLYAANRVPNYEAGYAYAYESL